MKKVLIVCPHFPPVNAADMHRVRQSLPYFRNFGWEPTVLTVDPKHVEMAKDKLLESSIPESIEIHRVSALSTTYTRKLGLGNLGLRAFPYLLRKGNELLKAGNFDLVYFSTTVFAAMPLGPMWKKKFNIPFIIDMQDPWRNDYYLTVPKEEQPPKFWFAYRLDKTLEAFTIPKTDGILAVSEGYIDMLQDRYPETREVPTKTMTFGAAARDYKVLQQLEIDSSLPLENNRINIIYIGRGGHDMQASLSVVFKAFKTGLESNGRFQKCKFWFIGTSYAPDGQGIKTIEPIAEKCGVADYVEEITDRKPYFEVLSLLKKADIILIPGSDDKNYTASKLYPNVLAEKPLLCVFHSNSSVVNIVKDLNAGRVVLFDEENAEKEAYTALSEILNKIPFVPDTKWENFEPYTAETMTKKQCDFFDSVLRTKAKNA